MPYNSKHDLTPEQIKAMTTLKGVRIYKNGYELVRGMRWPTPMPEPPTRKGIYEMSRQSKIRMAHLVANCDVKWKSLITLTYGDFFVPLNGKELKRQLNIVLKSLRKRYDMEYFWFMEFTKKRKPHFHIITTILPNVIDRFWLADRWAKISVTDVVKDLRESAIAGDIRELYPIEDEIIEEELRKVTAVHKHKKTWDKIYKPDGATRYMLKYASKEAQKLVPVEFGNCGRFWGASGGVKAEPIAQLIVGEDITQEQLETFLQNLLPKDLPLIPKFLFINNARQKIEGEGFTLRELNGNRTHKNASLSSQEMVYFE